MDTQVQIRDRLARELADAAAPPLGSLVADAVAAGGRMRRRRRFGVAASGAATAAVMVAVGVLLAGAPRAGMLSTPGEGGSPRAGTTAPGPTSTPPAMPAGHAATTGQAVVALLLDLLPPGAEISEVEHWVEAGNASGGFLYDDGRGAATVSAGVADRPADYGSSVTGMRCPPDDDGFVCEYRTLPDGTEIRTLRLGPYEAECADAKCGIVNLRVEIRRPDGVYVMVDSYNGPFGHNRAPTRRGTLLDDDQMVEIARDPRWGLTMESSFVDAAAVLVARAS